MLEYTELLTLWLCVEFRPSLACLADGRCVDEGCDVLFFCKPDEPASSLSCVHTLMFSVIKR
jgi:hypothetical protein